jgi:hypothetical protein
LFLTCQSALDWITTAAVRLGTTLPWSDRTLLYVKGGGAVANENVSVSCIFGVPFGRFCLNSNNVFTSRVDASRTIWGGMVGQRRAEKLWLTLGARWIRVWWMIRPGFLSAAERGALIVVARDGLVEHRVARRANAIVLLNDGWNCEEVGSALLLDDDTVREWFGVYQRQGMAGLRNFGHEGSSCQLTDEQQTALKALSRCGCPAARMRLGPGLGRIMSSATATLG